jgi:hypothetical protein
MNMQFERIEVFGGRLGLGNIEADRDRLKAAA